MPTSDELFAMLPEFEKSHRRSANEAKKLGRMVEMYGPPPAGVRCGDCVSFTSVKLARTYHKCLRFGNTAGASTDWWINWPGCGKFKARS